MKLNLGCGYIDHKDWVNVDNLDYKHNVIADVLEGLPYDDNTFDYVLMNHTLQMFGYEELPVVLKEVKRVMKKGATLRILTPDLVLAFNAVVQRDKNYFPISDELESTMAGKFARYIFWHGDTRCAFDEPTLKALLQKNGYKDVKSGKYGDCELDSRKQESLIMEATK